MIVADANLTAYLILGGPEQARARQVYQKEPAWAAPLLWRSEFTNVLAKLMQQRGLLADDARQAFEMASELMRDREFTVMGERVLACVSSSQCSAYDCEYVALAEDLAVPLVTADRQLVRSFPGRAIGLEDFLR